jgi:hypothetical protein
VSSLSVRLADGKLEVRTGREALVAVPSMQHPDFQRILARGWVSPRSFGPAGDLRIYSAAYTSQGEERYAWFASADWRRGRMQIDRRGAISDIAMAPYGSGKGKVRGDAVEVVPDYARGSVAITVNEDCSALGRWTQEELRLETDQGSSHVADAPFACALFLWCARPIAFLVEARPPF